MRTYGCCEHCKHDVNDPPHDRPCLEGCEEDGGAYGEKPGFSSSI